MKYVLLILTFTVFNCSYSQEFGVFVQGNTGSIWVKNSKNPGDGTFAYYMEPGFGGGISYGLMLTKILKLDNRLSYMVCQYRYQDLISLQ